MGLLDNVFGAPSPGRGMSPLTLALLGTLAYKALKNKGPLAQTVQNAGSSGGLGGLLGGGALGSGLSDLLKKLTDNGHGDKASSWLSGTTPNRPIAPHELEAVLGEERIQWLMHETGLSRDELLAGLSRELPDKVDLLTPNGHPPTDEELKRLS